MRIEAQLKASKAELTAAVHRPLDASSGEQVRHRLSRGVARIQRGRPALRTSAPRISHNPNPPTPP